MYEFNRKRCLLQYYILGSVLYVVVILNIKQSMRILSLVVRAARVDSISLLHHGVSYVIIKYKLSRYFLGKLIWDDKYPTI